MGLQINVALTAQDGTTIPTGTYVVLKTHIPKNELVYRCSFEIHTSKASADAGNVPFLVKEFKPFYVKSLTKPEADALTSVIIQNDAKAYLESIFGAGNVSIV